MLQKSFQSFWMRTSSGKYSIHIQLSIVFLLLVKDLMHFYETWLYECPICYISSEENTHLQDDHVSSSHESLGIKLLLKSNQLLLGESVKEVPSSTVARKNTKYSVSSER